MVCSRCKAAPYCNRACQKAHRQDHKKICCKDITILSHQEGENLVSSLLGKVKKDPELFETLYQSLGNNLKSNLTVLSAKFNRSTKSFTSVKILTMSVADYQRATELRSEHTPNVNDLKIHFMIFSERNHLMLNGTIPLEG